MKKKIPSKSLDQLVSKYKKSDEFKIAYEERRFYLQIAHLIRDLREKVGFSQAEVAKKAKSESTDDRSALKVVTIDGLLRSRRFTGFGYFGISAHSGSEACGLSRMKFQILHSSKLDYFRSSFRKGSNPRHSLWSKRAHNRDRKIWNHFE